MNMELNQLCKNFEAASNAAYEARHALQDAVFPILKELGDGVDSSDSIEQVAFGDDTGGHLTLEISYFNGESYTSRAVNIDADIVRADDPLEAARAVRRAKQAERERLDEVARRRRAREEYIRNAVADAEREAAKKFDKLHPPK